MRHAMSASPPTFLATYMASSGFWGDPAEFDFWYALSAEEWYWLHLRRTPSLTLAISFFWPHEGPIEVELFDLTHAPVNGLRATIINTPLATLDRYEPPLPLVALRLRNGWSHHFTLARNPQSLADQWLDDVLGRLRGSLAPRWRVAYVEWAGDAAALRALWPGWAGPAPD